MASLALLAVAAVALTLVPLVGAATSVTLTLSTTPNAASARTPNVIGVNAGAAWPHLRAATAGTLR